MQDNQCLGYGLLGMQRLGLPVLATIHHPITVDRRLEMEHSESAWKRLSKARWYGFTKMQTRVASRMPRVVTVSQNSLTDIAADHASPSIVSTSCPSGSTRSCSDLCPTCAGSPAG